MTAPPPATVAEIPATLLYWGVVEAAVAGRRQENRFLVERFLPVSIDALHETWCRMTTGDWLFVGIEPERLRAYLSSRQDLGQHTWQLIPDSVPSCVGARGERVREQLNLLQGAFEPAGRRRLRQTLQGVAAAGLMVALSLVLIGTERRHRSLLDAAAQLGADTHRRLDAAVPAGPGEAGIPPEQRLVVELRRLEASAKLGGKGADAARALQAVLANLPADLRIQLESLIIAPDRIMMRARTADFAAAERLHKACSTLVGIPYAAGPLQAQQAEGCALAMITLVPVTGER